MTIDERLEKLTERHEALAASVQMMQTEGIRLQKLIEMHERRFETHAEQHEREWERQQAERAREREDALARGKALDERIDKLVSAIGEFMRRAK